MFATHFKPRDRGLAQSSLASACVGQCGLRYKVSKYFLKVSISRQVFLNVFLPYRSILYRANILHIVIAGLLCLHAGRS